MQLRLQLAVYTCARHHQVADHGDAVQSNAKLHCSVAAAAHQVLSTAAEMIIGMT
jgi:hypothetical protein